MVSDSYTFPIETLLTHEQLLMASLPTQSELAFNAAQIPKMTLHLLPLVEKLNSRKMPSFDTDFSFPIRTELGQAPMSFSYDSHLSKNGKYEMKIEVPSLYDVSLDGKTASFELNRVSLIAGIFHVFHEYRHLQQYVDLKRVDPVSKDTVKIAKVEAIRKMFPGYYWANHDQHLIEINAEIYAAKATMKYAEKQMPGLDAEKLLLEANEKRLLGLHVENCQSINEFINALEKRKANPERCDLKEATDFPYPISQKANSLLTSQFFRQYDLLKTAQEKDDFIFEAVVKIHPSLKMAYPSLMSPRVLRMASSLQFLKPVSSVHRKLVLRSTQKNEKDVFSKHPMKKIYRQHD